MGYLKDFRESFAKRLEALDPEEMQETLNVACNALLESYRNGQKSAQPQTREERTDMRNEGRGASAPAGKRSRPARAWKKRPA
jgi:hypothetical protein